MQGKRRLSKEGKIVNHHSAPRSYEVETPQGVFRRNQRHLQRSASPRLEDTRPPPLLVESTGGPQSEDSRPPPQDSGGAQGPLGENSKSPPQDAGGTDVTPR